MAEREEQNGRPDAWDPIAGARAVGSSAVEVASVPCEAVLGMGCGNPVALAALCEGETVVDLGCGGGFDAFLASARVGPSGRVIGVDHSDEMLAIARTAARRGRYANVEFRLGTLEHLPVEDTSVDVIISNCVISDVLDKRAAFAQAARALKPGGRMVIADLVLACAPPDDLSTLPRIWADWIGHAPGRDAYLGLMTEAGLREVRLLREQPYESPGTPAELLGVVLSILVGAVR